MGYIGTALPSQLTFLQEKGNVKHISVKGSTNIPVPGCECIIMPCQLQTNNVPSPDLSQMCVRVINGQ